MDNYEHVQKTLLDIIIYFNIFVALKVVQNHLFSKRAKSNERKRHLLR